VAETILKPFQCSVSVSFQDVRTSEIKLQLNNAAGGRLKRNKFCFISVLFHDATGLNAWRLLPVCIRNIYASYVTRKSLTWVNNCVIVITHWLLVWSTTNNNNNNMNSTQY